MGRKIKRVIIDNLIYGIADFIHDFNPNLTIITGPNGSGKTTILNTIDDLVNREHSFKPWAPMNSITVIFDNDAEVRWKKGGKVEKIGDWKEIELTEVREEFGDIEANVQSYVEDLVLSGREDVIKLLEEYLEIYKIGGSRFLERAVTNISRKDDGIKIPVNRLSLGEMILLRLFANLPHSGIYLIDTPEISLHLAIQNDLLEKLMELEPETQFIIATHSPSLIGNHWNDDTTVDLFANERKYTSGNKELLSSKSNKTGDS